MKKTFIWLITLSIILGFMAFALDKNFGLKLTFIKEIEIEQANGQILKTHYFDIGEYIQNLAFNVTDTPTILPIFEQSTFWEDFANSMILIANLLTIPIRILAYIANITLALIGIGPDTETGVLTWLVELIDILKQPFGYI